MTWNNYPECWDCETKSMFEKNGLLKDFYKKNKYFAGIEPTTNFDFRTFQLQPIYPFLLFYFPKNSW
jgi:hypothetical protein